MRFKNFILFLITKYFFLIAIKSQELVNNSSIDIQNPKSNSSEFDSEVNDQNKVIRKKLIKNI